MGKLSYTLKHFLTIKVPIKGKLLNCLQECTSKKLWKSQYGNKISAINITLPNKVIFINVYTCIDIHNMILPDYLVQY